MTSISQARRRQCWSKHTSYPTANGDKIHKPSEVAIRVLASVKAAENDLNAKKCSMGSVHRKSIGQLDFQRKLLEKSMLAYCNKIKEINDSRTNELFREIHTQSVVGHDTIVTALVTSRSSLSIDSPKQEDYRSKSMNDLSDMNSSGDKNLEKAQLFTQTKRVFRRQRSQSAENVKSMQQQENTLLSRKLLHLSERDITEQTVSKLKLNSISKSNTRFSSSASRVLPRVAINSLPWNDLPSDSEYSSGSEETENNLGSFNSTEQTDLNESPSIDTHLTVPVLIKRKRHVRKRE